MSGLCDGDVIFWDIVYVIFFFYVSSVYKGYVIVVECLEDIKNKIWEEC